MARTIEYWTVRVIADVEGRSSKTVAAFADEREADEFSTSDQGRDMYGASGTVDKAALVIFNTAEEAGAVSVVKLREQAIAKLTAAERSALGLG